MSIDRLKLLGVTADQLRQKQADERRRGMMGLYQSAQDPFERLGISLGMLGGSIARKGKVALFGEGADIERQKNTEDVLASTDLTDINSILGSADVLRETDPQAAARLEMFGNQLTQKAQQAALDAEDRKLQGDIDRAKLAKLKAETADIKAEDIDTIEAPTKQDFELFDSVLGTKQGQQFIQDIRDVQGKGILNFAEDAEVITPVIRNTAAAIYAANRGKIDVATAFSQAKQKYLSGEILGTAPEITETAQPTDAFSNVTAGETTTQTEPEVEAVPLTRTQQRAQAEAKRQKKIEENKAKLKASVEKAKARNKKRLQNR